MSLHRSLRLLLGILLLLAPAWRGVAAQPAASPVLRPVDLSAIHGRIVRVTVRQGDVLVGRLGGFDATALTLVQPETARSVELGAIDTLWVRQSSVGRGALIGSLTLGVAGGLLLGWAANGLCESSCDDEFRNGLLIGTPMGMGAGLLIGAGVGALLPRWQQRFPERVPRAAPPARMSAR